VRRVAIIASASGNGKTTLGRQIAARLGVRFVELDALVHGPGWTETPDDELRALVEPVVRSDAWVIDGTYTRKLGSLVLDAADTVVWLDLPTRVWFPRLLRRTARRVSGREQLWNGNRETLPGAFWGRESLFGYALLQQRVRRRDWPAALAAHPVVRLRSPAAVDEWLANIALPARHHASGHVQADRDPGARRGRGGGVRRR
jgi:adenylate kinase family enzyme